MAASERLGESWLDNQRVREERMRYELLYAIYHAAERSPCIRIDTAHFLEGLGVWGEELGRVLRYLVERGFLSYDEGGPGPPPENRLVACITQKGIDYVQQEARRRRSIRNESPQVGP